MTVCYFSVFLCFLRYGYKSPLVMARACHLVGAMSVPGAMLTGHFCGRDTMENT